MQQGYVIIAFESEINVMVRTDDEVQFKVKLEVESGWKRPYFSKWMLILRFSYSLSTSSSSPSSPVPRYL